MKMLKFLSLSLLAFVLGFPQAFAAPVWTATTREEFRDSAGNTKVRVYGTVALDSAYNCNFTTGICGEAVNAPNIGMSSIDQMWIEPTYLKTIGKNGGTILWRYHSTGLVDNGGAGLSTANIRAYYWGNDSAGVTGAIISAGPFISIPSYDLSALTAVSFAAVGSL